MKRKNKKKTIDLFELTVLALDSYCRMVDMGLIQVQKYLPTAWQRQGNYEHEFNENGYTGRYRAVA